jgi:CIC family chloride channel protein
MRKKLTDRLSSKWKERPNLETPGWLFVWGGVVGLFTGAVTVLYRFLVNQGNQAIWGSEEIEGYESLLRLCLPAVGGLVVGLLLYKFLKSSPGHGVPSVIHAIQTNKIRIPPKMAIPSTASVVVLTTGGSAGPEGPAAEIGAVFGSNIGRLLGASQKTLRALVGAGVAGAIAAVFSAPIGGVFFALEILFQGFEMTLFAPVVMSAVVASMVTEVSAAVGRDIGFLNEPAITNVPPFNVDLSEIPFYAGLGLLVGLLAAGFIRWLEFCATRFERLQVPVWLKPAIGGLGVGVLGYWVPEVTGEGYEFLQRELTGDILIASAAVILVGKILATGLTLGSGAPGGSFAPAIFIGGAFGGLYGGLLKLFSLGPTEPASYALMGMAGMIAGTFNAPMTAIMLTLRITEGNYLVLLPLMTTVAVAHFMMGRWENVSVYTSILKRHGQWFPADYEKDPLLQLTVGDVLVPSRLRLSESLGLGRALERIGESEESVFTVESEAGEFQGLLTLNDLKAALADPLMGKLLTLGDVVDEDVSGVSPEMSLREAVHEFTTTRVEALPVFNADRYFLGLVTRDAVLTAYRKAKSRV